MALALPELTNSSMWVSHALEQLEYEMAQEVYPDGVETEETTGYDFGTALDFFNVLQTLAAAGLAPPPTLHQSVENMFNILAYGVDQVRVVRQLDCDGGGDEEREREGGGGGGGKRKKKKGKRKKKKKGEGRGKGKGGGGGGGVFYVGVGI